MKILYEKENPLLGRKRMAFEIDHKNGPTPSKESIKKKASELLKVNENLIVLKHIYTKFGNNKSKVIINVYNDERDLKSLETFNKKKKKNKTAKAQ